MTEGTLNTLNFNKKKKKKKRCNRLTIVFYLMTDMIAIPDFAAGAMENWGLITYRETAMLYEDGVSSESNLQRVNVVIAHELAHQVHSY